MVLSAYSNRMKIERISRAAEDDHVTARLAFLLPDFRIGGAERVALSLITEFVNRGIEVDLVLLRCEGELLELLPTGVNVVPLRAGRIRNSILPLARYLRERKPDGLQASIWPITLAAILGRAIARSSCRLVISDHSNVSLPFRERPFLRRLIGWSMRVFYPFADARLCVSRDVAVDLAEVSGLNQSRFEVVYNPIEQRSGQWTAEAEAQWKTRGRRILSVGTLKREKNHLLLMRAFAILCRHEAASLTIVGEGPMRLLLESVAEDLGISEAVSMPGQALDPTPYYATANLFALTSDFEGFANVLVEAMAAGLPVVSVDCRSGPREVLADGEFGRLVPVDDAEALAMAIEQSLLEGPDPERLKARASQFRPELAANRYAEFLLGDRH